MNKLIYRLKTILFILYKFLKYPKSIFQYIFPQYIPIIIINYNQLYYLQKLINFLIKRGFKNIVIIDNNSTYPPLLKYYEDMKGEFILEKRYDNLGHMVFYKDPIYMKRYGKGFYVLTDADIVPNKDLPANFLKLMIHILFRYYRKVNKVGFALRIDDIPDYYSLKHKVLKWERRYWDKQIEANLYLADIDTTFALYKPNYRLRGNFYSAIRIDDNFVAKHGGWYLDVNNLTDEQSFYLKNANNSSSWKINDEGRSNNDLFSKAYE